MASQISSCNLYDSLDKPSGDQQLLAYARSCLNRGDYVCAQDAYAKLSNSMSDIRINEQGITTLAQNNLFSIQDLISVLGDGTGSGASIRNLAELIAGRSRANAANRQIIQSVYSSAANINDSSLRAYLRFISATAMFAAVLGAAAEGDNVISLNELAATGATCKLTSTTCAASATCDAPVGTSLANFAASVSLNTASDWTGAVTLDHITEAATQADAAVTVLTGTTSSNSGLFASIRALSQVGGLANRCARQLLVQTFF